MAFIDLVAFAIAVVICTAGVAATAGHLLRPRPRDRLLLWFGLFSSIYGARMFFKQTLASGLGVHTSTALWVEKGLNMLFVLNEHAVGARIVPWRLSAAPVGLLAQLGCFGYIALTRVFAQGRQLAAVDQEMRSAREIQTSILPRDLPALRGLQIAARYVPLAAVAGDFYDVVALDSRVLAVLVADVSGHGVPAALIASMVKAAFTACLRETDDPGAVLGRMNTTLCGMFERSYVTAACAVLRPDAGILSYALAGHPPALLLPEHDGRMLALDERGLFLGFMPSATYTTTSVPIGPGARLIVYSDGVTETPAPDDDLFGIERLSAFLARERHQPPESFADALMAALHRFTGRATLPHDDVTLVVVDVATTGATAASCNDGKSSGRLRP